MESAHPVLHIIAHLWDPVARRVNYLRKIGRNMNNLQNQVNELTRSGDDLQMEVYRAAQEGKVPKNEVQGWLDDANAIIRDATAMQEEFSLNKKCFYGWCHDCLSRYKLGKRIVEATEVVRDLRAKNNFSEIAVLPLQESVQELATTTIREQTSTAQAQDMVWNWLMDARTRKIGIWGMAGVGKTRLMKNINNSLRGTQHFDVVIFVTVSKDWNMKKLRNDIGKEISLDLSAEEDDERASRLLFMALNTKKFLLILDDVWDRLDLFELGVPTHRGSGCKVALTTRDRGVCNVMETNEEIMVKVLPPDEAWELFQEKAGSVVSPGLEPTARQVCQECHGLPLAIIVVGRALRKENGIKVWKNAFRVLKDSQFELRDMEREVYLPLKFSYDHLETDTLRNCFLYCSLFPEDYAINMDRLIELWTVEGFIEAVGSLEEASVKGHYLLKELTDSCLLEKDNISEETVKMHDVIRDMAIKITSESTEEGSRFLVKAGVGLQRCPEVEKWEGKDRISLMENNIRFLPDEPKSTELSTLLLQGNDLQVIPQSFFNQMKNLHVLDLSGTMIKSLPDSIYELGCLQALVLRECFSLDNVNHVGGLKQLQLLDLRYTEISELPSEIGQLTRLRRLNLSCTFELQDIPADSIISLPLLEDLEMNQSGYLKRSKDGGAYFFERMRFAPLFQLTHFSADVDNRLLERSNHLTHFSADVDENSSSSMTADDGVWGNLKSFYLRVGAADPTGEAQYMKYTKRVALPKRRGRCADITETAEVILAAPLLRYAEILCLYNQNAVMTLSYLGVHNLKLLKECWIWKCDNMVSIIIADEAEKETLPKLEILVLTGLQNLRSIWEGDGTPGSFTSMKNITLSQCRNVTYLFSSDVLQLLHFLEELNISICPRMKEIVVNEVGNGDIALPGLRRVVLKGLPQLHKMWNGVLALESLREIEVTSCRTLMQLDMDIDNTPALKVIRGERQWWDNLIWQDFSCEFHFGELFKLVTHDDIDEDTIYENLIHR